MGYLNDDRTHGKRCETLVKRTLEDTFGELTQDPERYASFDFFNDNYFVEHKQRNLTFGRYDSLMFEYSKYKTYLAKKKENPSLRFFIVWSLTDGKYVWEFEDQFRGDDAVFMTDADMSVNRGTHVQNSTVVKVFNEYISKLDEFYVYI